MQDDIIYFNSRKAAENYVSKFAGCLDTSCKGPTFDQESAKWMIVVYYNPLTQEL